MDTNTKNLPSLLRRAGSKTAGAAALATTVATVAVLAAGTGGDAGPSTGNDVELSASTSETLVGPPGPRGPRGFRGYTGYRGYRGYTGAKGPQGPSGTVQAFNFSGSWGPETLPGNGGNTYIKPIYCTTPTHVAGPGETALISMTATGVPNPAASDTLYLDAMFSVDGGNVQLVNATGMAAESMADGIGNVTTSTALTLQEGHTYQFRAGLASNGQVKIPANGGYCQGTVQIVRMGA